LSHSYILYKITHKLFVLKILGQKKLLKGTFIKIGTIGIVTSASFSCFCVKNILIFHIFKICFDDNVINILWKHMQWFKNKSNEIWVLKNINGWKSFKVYHTGRKRPTPYYNPILPYILIPIKINESKLVKIFRNTIFYTITIINSIIIIHKCVFTW